MPGPNKKLQIVDDIIKPYWQDGDGVVRLYNEDNLKVMAQMQPDSIDAVVCDPPYGLEFMGKEWDKLGAKTEVCNDGMDKSHPERDGTRRIRHGASASSMQQWHQTWAESALRVAKPGAYLLAFGGSRTFHRLVCAVEDAGWEVRDCVMWVYGTGFPKSHDVSKAIDKSKGENRNRPELLQIKLTLLLIAIWRHIILLINNNQQ